jgi:hypothetical protein
LLRRLPQYQGKTRGVFREPRVFPLLKLNRQRAVYYSLIETRGFTHALDPNRSALLHRGSSRFRNNDVAYGTRVSARLVEPSAVTSDRTLRQRCIALMRIVLRVHFLQNRINHAAPRAGPLVAPPLCTRGAKAEAAFRRAAALSGCVLDKSFVDDNAVFGECHSAVVENNTQQYRPVSAA